MLTFSISYSLLIVIILLELKIEVLLTFYSLLKKRSVEYLFIIQSLIKYKNTSINQAKNTFFLAIFANFL